MIFLLYLLALTPLVFSSSSFFPAISAKTVFIRLIIASVSCWFFIALFVQKSFREKVMTRLQLLMKNRIFVSVCAYFGFLIISTLLAVDRFSAFFGTLDRSEGLVGMLFFFGFF